MNTINWRRVVRNTLARMGAILAMTFLLDSLSSELNRTNAPHFALFAGLLMIIWAGTQVDERNRYVRTNRNNKSVFKYTDQTWNQRVAECRVIRVIGIVITVCSVIVLNSSIIGTTPGPSCTAAPVGRTH